MLPTPSLAQAIKTDTDGLAAGEVEIRIGDYGMQDIVKIVGDLKAAVDWAKTWRAPGWIASV